MIFPVSGEVKLRYGVKNGFAPGRNKPRAKKQEESKS